MSRVEMQSGEEAREIDRPRRGRETKNTPESPRPESTVHDDGASPNDVLDRSRLIWPSWVYGRGRRSVAAPSCAVGARIWKVPGRGRKGTAMVARGTVEADETSDRVRLTGRNHW